MLRGAGVVLALQENIGEQEIDARQAMLRIESPRRVRAFLGSIEVAQIVVGDRVVKIRGGIFVGVQRQRPSAEFGDCLPVLLLGRQHRQAEVRRQEARINFDGLLVQLLRFLTASQVGVDIAELHQRLCVLRIQFDRCAELPGRLRFLPFLQKILATFKRLFRIPRRLQRRGADAGTLYFADSVQHDRPHAGIVEKLAPCQRNGIRTESRQIRP